MTSFIVGKPSSGKLIVLDGDDKLTAGKETRQQYPGQNSFREGNGSAKSSIRSLGSRVGSVPSRPGSQSGPPCSSTPTRQVVLPKVKRKDSREEYNEVDRHEIESVKASISRENSMLDESFNADSGLPSSTSSSFMTQLGEDREDSGDSATPRAEAAHTSGEGTSKQPQQASSSKQPNEEDSSSDSEEEEKEERKAPTDLFMEFLTCLMSKDYPNALKLCKMILIYEPNHAEALKFLPLIQEKMELDEMPDDPEGGEGNADENEDEDEDDDDSDDDDDDDDESSDEDDSGSDVDEEEFQQIFRREDSGVASASDDP